MSFGYLVLPLLMRLRLKPLESFMKPWFLLAALVFVLSLSASHARAAYEWDQLLPARSEIHDEADPSDEQPCDVLGELNLNYESGETGSPKVGLRITDPRGRKFGYDPGSDRGWQELPRAEGFVECDENEDTSSLRYCAGHIEICGPISGTYKIEVLPAQNSHYSLTVSSISQTRRSGLHPTTSLVRWQNEIESHVREILLLQYSREAGVQTRLLQSNQRVASREKHSTRSVDASE